MNFVFHSGTIKSKNDEDIHKISSFQTEECFSKALHNFKYYTKQYTDVNINFNEDIHLYPREDGNYSMIDEIFKQFIPKEKWASVAITSENGKPFYIKNKDLVGEWNGENKNYPIYAWFEEPVNIPEPPKDLKRR